MTTRKPDFVRLFNQAVQRARTSDYRAMLTGRIADDGSVTLAGAPTGKVWVRATEDSRELTAAWGYCSQINIQVMVGYATDGSLEIKGPDYNATATQLGDALQSVFTPPIVGELTNISIAGMNFKPGRVRPYGTGLYVTADSFFHEGGYWDADLSPLDLTTNVPGTSGQVRWVVVALDPATNTLAAFNGTAVVGNVRQLAVADAAAISVTTGYIRLGAVALAYGQTTIDNTTRMTDMREYIAPRTPASGLFGYGSLGYTADATIDLSFLIQDLIVNVDASAGNVTLTLPSSANMTAIRITVTKTDSSANTVTLVTADSSLISGSTSVIIEYQYTSVTIVFNSAVLSAWVIV